MTTQEEKDFLTSHCVYCGAATTQDISWTIGDLLVVADTQEHKDAWDQQGGSV